jgi:polyphenol oxidase
MQDSFVLHNTNGTSYYTCRAIEQIPGFCHGFSTRHGGLPDTAASSLNLGYTTWDSPERINANRQRFLAALDLGHAELITLHQIHSDRIHIIKDVSDQWNRTEGDALITQCKDLALSVQTADCLPLLLADPVKRVAAVVHSGWRGTLARIPQKTIREMESVFSSNPQNLIVAMGPGIRSCCFEVGEEVDMLFTREYPDSNLATPVTARPGKFLLDLVKALEIQLNQAGIKRKNIYDIGVCTRCHVSEFFSYRAEGQSAGRMMAIIGIRF